MDESEQKRQGQKEQKSSLDPFEINFLPQFKKNRGPQKPFVNQHGVTIGDHDYESPQSPLEQWTEETDPFVMAGDQWVHPFKDVGFHSQENRDYFERGIQPQSGVFMHPDKNTSVDLSTGSEESPAVKGNKAQLADDQSHS